MWTVEAWDDYVYWHGQDKKTLGRIKQLIKDVQLSPFEGIGKPEPLRRTYSIAGMSVTSGIMMNFNCAKTCHDIHDFNERPPYLIAVISRKMGPFAGPSRRAGTFSECTMRAAN